MTSSQVYESLKYLTEQLSLAKALNTKKQLEVLYRLKQDNAPSSSAIAKESG
ncbi:MAG: hypothetical protein AB1589_41720 [Cyanobacteriota bacterium]